MCRRCPRLPPRLSHPTPPRPPFRPRYGFRWREAGVEHELLVWPDDRYTLERRADGAHSGTRQAIDASRADRLIREHGLGARHERSESEREELQRQLREAFLRAAEGLAVLADAERQIAEATERDAGPDRAEPDRSQDV